MIFKQKCVANPSSLTSAQMEKKAIVKEIVSKLSGIEKRHLEILYFEQEGASILPQLINQGHKVTRIVYSHFPAESPRDVNQSLESIVLTNDLESFQSALIKFNFDLVIMINAWEEIFARGSHQILDEVVELLIKNELNILWEYPIRYPHSYFEFFDFNEAALSLLKQPNFTIPIPSQNSISLNFSSNNLMLIGGKLLSKELTFLNHKRDSAGEFRKKIKHRQHFYKILLNQNQYTTLYYSRKTSKAVEVISNARFKSRYKYSTKIIFNRLNSAVILKRRFIPGETLDRLIEFNSDVLSQKLIELFLNHEQHIRHHGDLRPWNFIWNGKEFYLIDPDPLGDESQIPFWAHFFYLLMLITKKQTHAYNLAELAHTLNSIPAFQDLISQRKDLNSISLKKFILEKDFFPKVHHGDTLNLVEDFLSWALINGK